MPTVEVGLKTVVDSSAMKALRELERTATLMMDIPIMLDRWNKPRLREERRRGRVHLRAIEQARMVLVYMGHDDAAYGPKDCEEKSEVKVEVCPERNGIPNENCQCVECKWAREDNEGAVK